MSEKTSFKKKINGDSVKVTPEEVKKVKRVNGACTDIELKGGETMRIKGSYGEVQEKLGIELKPELKRFDET